MSLLRWNPELQRHLWVYCPPSMVAAQLILIPVIIYLLDVQSWVSLLEGVFAFAVIVGPILWGLAASDEYRRNRWDMRRLSALGPWQLSWGKLLGASASTWMAVALVILSFLLFKDFSVEGLFGLYRFSSDRDCVLSLNQFVGRAPLSIFVQGILGLVGAASVTLMIIVHGGRKWEQTQLLAVFGVLSGILVGMMFSRAGGFFDPKLAMILPEDWCGDRPSPQTRDFLSLSEVFWGLAQHLTMVAFWVGWAVVGLWRVMRGEFGYRRGWVVWMLFLASILFVMPEIRSTPLFEYAFDAFASEASPAILPNLLATIFATLSGEERLSTPVPWAMILAILYFAYYFALAGDDKSGARLVDLGAALAQGRIRTALEHCPRAVLALPVLVLVGVAALGPVFGVKAALLVLRDLFLVFAITLNRTGSRLLLAVVGFIVLYVLVPALLGQIDGYQSSDIAMFWPWILDMNFWQWGGLFLQVAVAGIWLSLRLRKERLT